MLQAEGLCAWYGAAQILHGITLQVGRGEVVALMGRNGAGKSTTLKTLMGLVPRRSGSIRFMGHDLSHSPPDLPARLGMGYVPEDRRIFTDLSVRDNLEVGRQPPRHWPDGSSAPTWDAAALFELFPNLAGMTTRRAAHMSGGEQQMLTVARTLMGNPLLLLLDEPSEGVAPIIVEKMVAMVQSLKVRGVSVLLSEQNLHFAAQVADRAYVLENGALRFEGGMQALMGDAALRRDCLGV